MVWVNTDSGVYLKPGTPWYGKTKQGKHMTEADAQEAGYRATAAAAPKKKSNYWSYARRLRGRPGL